jgi:hypothetical protein
MMGDFGFFWMTSDGILDADWQNLESLAEEFAESVERGDADASLVCRKRLLDYLDCLETAYGKLASILATRADYADRLEDRITLYLQAWELAVTNNDAPNITFISSSLAQVYLEEAGNFESANEWLLKLSDALAVHWDDFEHQEFLRLKKLLPAGE